MNKLIFCLIIIGAIHIQAMKDSSKENTQEISLQDLPIEMLVYIISQSNYLIQAIINIHILKMTNNHLYNVYNQETIRMIARNFIQNNPEEAAQEFRWLIANCTQFHEWKNKNKFNSKLKFIKIFIDGGIELNKDYNILYRCAYHKIEKKLCLKCGEKIRSPLIYAIDRDASKLLIQFLINNGADVNYKPKGYPMTPLAALVRHYYEFNFHGEEEDIKLIKLFLQKGSDPNERINGGRSAMEIAPSGAKALFKLLIEKSNSEESTEDSKYKYCNIS